MKILKKIIPFLALLPFAAGAVGYIMAGEGITDALYASFALYFVNPVSEGYNILVDIARWTAALVTTSAILYAVRRIWLAIANRLYCRLKDSVAVYSDNDIKIDFGGPRKKALYLGTEFIPAAKSQIIMFDLNESSFKFYEEHKNQLKNRKVYIGSKGIGCEALKENPNVIFFDIDNAVARTLWKKIALWERRGGKTEITILGTGHLGQCVLNCALLMNLYSRDQEIVYNFIGENDLYHISHGEISTFNNDSVRFFGYGGSDITSIIKNSDIVIVCERISSERMHTLSVICGGSLYFYSPDNDICEYLNLPNAKMFGRNSEIYTDENIRRNKLISEAIDQHYNYLIVKDEANKKLDKLEEWGKLDGFTKWSNISSSDYKHVLVSLLKKGKGIEELAELEHIRWCRFHILNHWKYGEIKDAEKKLHNCLCDFSKLEEKYKEYDREVVKEAMKMSENDPLKEFVDCK